MSEGMVRRGRGEGSISELEPGRWMGRVTVAPGRRRVVYGTSKMEVVRKMAGERVRSDTGGANPDARVTVATFLREWLDGPARARLRPSSFASYENYVHRHLIPGLGQHRLARLRPEHIDVFLAAKAVEGLSPRTCQYMRAILRSALAWAEKRGRVSQNAAKLSDAPRVERRELVPLTPEQAQLLVRAAESDLLGALYVVALDTGLRQGEVLGLRWQDVDLDTRTLRVVQVREHVKGPARFGPPKSASSRRGVTFTATTEAFLREHRAYQLRGRLAAGAKWKDSVGLVFTSGTGAPLDASTVTHRFKAFLKSHGLPDQRFHDLRHASASFLLSQGLPVKVVSERLGHSQISLTLNTYAHLAAELQGQAASAMDRILTGKYAGAS
jgi:integrase